MNTERLHLLADVVEKHSKQFRMLTWTNDACGTPACIAGFAAALADGRSTAKKYPEYKVRLIPEIGRAWLGLTSTQAGELFEPTLDDWNQITAEVAALCLRYLAETGKVDWEAVGATD